MRIGAVVLAIWLVIGVIAAGQRGYFSTGTANCAQTGDTILTIVAGPVNYLGINPKVECKTPPKPA
jgi:hypothetical protein